MPEQPALGFGGLLRQLRAGANWTVYCHAGEPARGLPLGLESIERARRLGDDVVLARSLTTYLAAGELIDPGHRGRLFIEAIACTERSGDRLVSIFLRINAGTHALCAGDVPAARAHFEQAAQTLQAIGGVPGHLVMINLGWVLREERDSDAAWSMFEAALRVSRRTRDREVEAVASVGLACLIADRGGWHQAAELHGAAQALSPFHPDGGGFVTVW